MRSPWPRAFEPYRLFWLEDALTEDDLAGWRRLRAATATPLCTGEKGWTVPHFRRLIDSGALDIVMLDPGRAEGVTGVKKVIDLAADAGLSWNAHSWSSALNTAASLHLAAASPNVLVLELKPEPSPMQHELVTDPIEMVDGWIAVRDSPGSASRSTRPRPALRVRLSTASLGEMRLHPVHTAIDHGQLVHVGWAKRRELHTDRSIEAGIRQDRDQAIEIGDALAKGGGDRATPHRRVTGLVILELDQERHTARARVFLRPCRRRRGSG